MAKKYIVKRYYKRRSKWSSNIKQIVDQQFTAPSQSEFYSTILLAQNPAQSDTNVSQQYTIKNVEFSFDIGVSNGPALVHSLESLTAYIVYIPQGFTLSSSTINNHPEWILAYKYLGGPDNDSAVENAYNFRNPLKIKSRLARRLQTGDAIYWLVTGINKSTSSALMSVNGIVRWWTKAN